jgi:uncharacterized RDD family membrane protein YckC
MNSPLIEFETPENVRIRYPVAGAGTRFLAWLLDQVIVIVGCAVLVIGLLIVGAASGALEGAFEGVTPENIENNPPQFVMYFFGAALLVMAFGSFVYYFTCELLMRGQTIGKRTLSLRVVKANGFALDPLSLFIRNAFRAIDHIAIFWPIPILSARTQRPGDMAAGTLVVSERQEPLSPVRQELADRDTLEARYRFDAPMLARLRPVDVEFVESLVDHWDDLPRRQLQRLLERSVQPLCRRLMMTPPAANEVLVFFEDLLAAEYRRRGHSVA